MLRQLYVFRCDLSQTAWWPSRVAPLPEGRETTLRWSWSDAVSGPGWLLQARDPLDALVYSLHLSREARREPWIGAELGPERGGAVITATWLHGKWRNRKVREQGVALACTHAARQNCTSLRIGLKRREIIPQLRLFARNGLGLLEASEVIHSIWCGVWLPYARRLPSKGLLSLCDKQFRDRSGPEPS